MPEVNSWKNPSDWKLGDKNSSSQEISEETMCIDMNPVTIILANLQTFKWLFLLDSSLLLFEQNLVLQILQDEAACHNPFIAELNSAEHCKTDVQEQERDLVN